MFGIGWQELLVILIVILIFVGPRKLPEVARSLGKALREFARAKEEVRRTIEKEFILQDQEKHGRDHERNTYLQIEYSDTDEDDKKSEDDKKAIDGKDERSFKS